MDGTITFSEIFPKLRERNADNKLCWTEYEGYDQDLRCAITNEFRHTLSDQQFSAITSAGYEDGHSGGVVEVLGAIQGYVLFLKDYEKFSPGERLVQ